MRLRSITPEILHNRVHLAVEGRLGDMKRRPALTLSSYSITFSSTTPSGPQRRWRTAQLREASLCRGRSARRFPKGRKYMKPPLHSFKNTNSKLYASRAVTDISKLGYDHGHSSLDPFKGSCLMTTHRLVRIVRYKRIPNNSRVDDARSFILHLFPPTAYSH